IRGIRVTLAERFIEISNWPTSRKVVFLTCIVMPAHMLAWAVWHLWVPRMPMLNSVLWNWHQAAWIGAMAFSLLISLPAALAGRDARWTAYISITLYSAFIAAMIYLFGSTSTVLMAFFPIAVVVQILYYAAAGCPLERGTSATGAQQPVNPPLCSVTDR
ncbi:MAG: hypothetical protein ACRESW_07575, partial [Nevskiales bacterium]